MDDRNLVAVAEQAAATSRNLRGPVEGATVKADDGRVFLGCRLEYEDPALDQDAVANGISAGRVAGMRQIVRIGIYSPVEAERPMIPTNTLRRMQELAAPGLAVIFSSGAGKRVELSLEELLIEAGLPA